MPHELSINLALPRLPPTKECALTPQPQNHGRARSNEYRHRCNVFPSSLVRMARIDIKIDRFTDQYADSGHNNAHSPSAASRCNLFTENPDDLNAPHQYASHRRFAPVSGRTEPLPCASNKSLTTMKTPVIAAQLRHQSSPTASILEGLAFRHIYAGHYAAPYSRRYLRIWNAPISSKASASRPSAVFWRTITTRALLSLTGVPNSVTRRLRRNFSAT